MGNARVTRSRLVGYLSPFRARITFGVLASIVSAAAAAGYTYLIGPLLKSVLIRGSAPGPFTQAWMLPAAIVGFAAVKAGAQFLQTGWMQSVGQRVVAALRRDAYARLLFLPPKFFEQRHSGELLSRFTSDASQVEFAVTQALSSYVKDSLQVIAQLAVCFAIDWRLFLLAFVVLPGAAIPVSRFARAVKKVATRTQASLGVLNELASEQLHNLPVVQAYRGEQRALRAFDAEQGGYLRAMQRSLFLRGAFTPTVEFLGIAGAALAIAFGAVFIAREPSLSGKLVSFLAAALLMYQPLKALSGTFSLVVQGLSAADRLFELADEPAPRAGGVELAPLARALEVRGLTVRYEASREALSDVSLTVPAGRKVALVGASGAGKSTLFSALLRFVEPASGGFTWDGVDLAPVDGDALRAQLAWVPQEPVLFSGTVRQNLLVGRPDAGEPALWEALRRAHAEDFVRALPGSLDGEVGERGAQLSGGQRQRLAIARAFLRQPSLLLLDEPTSALDAASEHEVQAGLAELLQGRTALVIAHRLSTVRDADCIYVLDAGRVVEQGTHDELLSRRGRYAALLSQGEVAA